MHLLAWEKQSLTDLPEEAIEGHNQSKQQTGKNAVQDKRSLIVGLPLHFVFFSIQRHTVGGDMRILLAILVPWLQFFTIGRPFAGIICLLLQITLVGWIPAAIWSVYALSQYKTDKKIEKALATKKS